MQFRRRSWNGQNTWQQPDTAIYREREAPHDDGGVSERGAAEAFFRPRVDAEKDCDASPHSQKEPGVLGQYLSHQIRKGLL
jgi:hypothetical protein